MACCIDLRPSEKNPSLVFSTYYYYFHRLARFPSVDEPHLSVHLPGLPILNSHEVPSFLHPSTIYHMLGNLILGQFQNLSKSFYVLVDSFEELEHEVIEAMSHLSLPPLRTIGPLFRSLKGSSSNSSNGVRGDFWTAAEGCIQWLDSQPLSSVVYISFGSIAFLPKDQMEEMAWGLLKTGLPFLWVVKPPAKEIATDTGLPAGFMDKAQGKGMVVEWCPQEQVLAHPSVACFVTHCGWNSSMECLTSGVPVVAFPQWGDQVTNAKFLVDKYGVGSLMGRSDRDSQLISRETVERCILEVARGPKTEEAKKNALKWKKAAEKAVANGGSSHRNIQAFVDEVRRLALTATSFEINT
uniref:Uncharacterized protein n=1 Tax=Nelumbo nucifera TaxID=4432 RepID=A0A822XIS4_NELNU|nr:TPA_asm: hypothetical protein HUJ06_022877 [Nelumbo nucifera]